MAKEKSTLKKFQTVAMPREKAKKVKGGYRDLSNVSFVATAPSFIGWGEVEIRKPITGFTGPSSGLITPGDI